MKKERLIAFTDAVLAIIMTILVLELEKPVEPTLEAFGNMKESFFAYILSFFWLGAMWINLHNIWEKVDKINTKVLWSNMLMLFFASLIPYTTSLVSIYFNNKTIQGFYGIVVLLLSLSNMLLNRELYKEDIKNTELVNMAKEFNKSMIIDVGIKCIGLIVSISIYPQAMMYSIIVAALYIFLKPKFLSKENKVK